MPAQPIPRNRARRFILIIRYVDHSMQKFELPPQWDEIKEGSSIQKLLDGKTLSIAVEDRLLVIPTQNIVSVEVRPIPAKLPDVVLRNVRLIE